MQKIEVGDIAICNLTGYEYDFWVSSIQITVIVTVESITHDRYLCRVECSNELLGQMVEVGENDINYLARPCKAKPDITDNLPEIFYNQGKITTQLQRDNRRLSEENVALKETLHQAKQENTSFWEADDQTVDGLMSTPLDYFPS